MTHAPGPWEALETGQVLDANGAVVVPEVWGEGDEQEGVDANARLIAAAPEMYEILRSLVGAGYDCSPEQDAARTIITKIEGEIK